MKTPSLSFCSRVAGEVEDEELIRQGDLIGGEAEALVGVHQLQHFLGVHPHLLVDGGQRPGDPTQGGMGILHNLHTAFRRQGNETTSGFFAAIIAEGSRRHKATPRGRRSESV